MTEMGWDPSTNGFEAQLENEIAQEEQSIMSYTENYIDPMFTDPSFSEPAFTEPTVTEPTFTEPSFTASEPMSNYTDPNVTQQEIDQLNNSSMSNFEDTMNQAQNFDNILNSGD